MKTIKVSDEVYERLREIREGERHRSLDSVLRKLLRLKPFNVDDVSPSPKTEIVIEEA